MLYATGSSFSGVRSVLGFIGILFFTAGFNFGFGALVWVYASESFPSRLRTTGASTMLTADLLANLLISRFFLTVFKDLGGMGTFALFLGLAVSVVRVRLRHGARDQGAPAGGHSRLLGERRALAARG